MPGNITRLYNFLSKLGLAIEPGEVDAELNQLVTAADTAIDDIDALEVDVAAVTSRVATIEGYDTDNRLDTLEAATTPTQHTIDGNNRVLLQSGNLSPSIADMLLYDLIVGISPVGSTLTLPTPDATMSQRTWTVVHSGSSYKTVAFGASGLDHAGRTGTAFTITMQVGDSLSFTVMPTNATGDGDYLYFILSRNDVSTM